MGNTSASGLDHRIDNLYADVVRNDNDRTSGEFRTDMMRMDTI